MIGRVPVSLGVVASPFACSGELAKVGKAFDVSKGTATGIVEGVEEGRKSAERITKIDKPDAVKTVRVYGQDLPR